MSSRGKPSQPPLNPFRTGDNVKGNGQPQSQNPHLANLPDDSVPAFDPPPYSAISEPGSVTLESNIPGFRPSLQPSQPQRPPQPPNRPANPHAVHSQSTHHNGHSGSSGSNKPRPNGPLGPPYSGQYGGHSSQWPGTAQRPGLQYGPPAHSGPPPHPHLRYPPGFWCAKCHNTGVKVDSGRTCKSCYEMFGRPNQFQMVPMGFQPVFTAPPRVVRPGDPSIGGALCGRCRGSGLVTELLFFEETCPLCHGLGRLR